MLEMMKKYNTPSAVNDFFAVEKDLQFEQIIPHCGHTLKRNENQSTEGEVENGKEEEQSEEEVKCKQATCNL